ncbi:hypothetical protein SAMN05421820_102315 [Pedobacter steynii]|uniref:Uncharacterized protein n=1 Tax=Pedobacter steynii TaxID=430522 RepID=A0A1G9NGA0_9SPHI|nr:hypothetical protein [Pedobacter steynii]NQX39314.1 hypothetical protein [Pedobacter steynii]SDL85381.1 hypothetical protein SAMN05421820_102315 [Pedobacter steynii]
MQSISTFFKEEDDFFCRKVEKETKERRNHEVAKSLILELDLPYEQIARIAKLDVAYVKKLRAEMENK